MTARSRMQIASVIACAALMVTPAFAGDVEAPAGGNGQGVCDLDGAWLGAITSPYQLVWTAVYDSDSHWTGPISLQFIGLDPTFFGLFPDARSYSATTGTWVRTGRRSFAYTQITYLYAAPDPATGQAVPVAIAKNTGIVELSGHCDSLAVQSLSIAVYAPDQDPFADDPLFCLPDTGIGSAQRMTADPPCEP